MSRSNDPARPYGRLVVFLRWPVLLLWIAAAVGDRVAPCATVRRGQMVSRWHQGMIALHPIAADRVS